MNRLILIDAGNIVHQIPGLRPLHNLEGWELLAWVEQVTHRTTRQLNRKPGGGKSFGNSLEGYL